jgi:microsomal dipeptidase-like Zn-dependent dipeptidase
MEMCQTIGLERVCLSTDYGWTNQVPRPAEGMVEFLDALWAEGVTERELEMMVSDNPSRLLNIDL